MKSKKLLSLLLALMMLLSVVPFYASAAEALKAANVTQWPTISYKNGQTTVYFGQTIGDALVINDDEIVLDASGNQVAGHFEFMKPSLISAPGTNIKSNIKFVPDDTTTYSGFNKLFFADATYDVTKVTPVFVDEANDPIIATDVNPGATLSTSILSGGAMTNPYNANEPNILAEKWEWYHEVNDGSTIVNESGYYTAYFYPIGYEMVTTQVYVNVKQNTVNTAIAEAPTVGELTYDANRTWADVALTGGKAVEEGTETEVAGTFAVTRVNGSSNLNKVVTDGDTVEVTFTPDDTDKYISSTTTITVTVNKALLKFLDENGNDVVPEYTIPYGYTLSNYEAGIFAECKKYLNTGDENIRLYFSEEDSKTMFPVGTHELTIGAAPYYTTSNYLKNDDLKVKITVEPKTLNPVINGGSADGYYVVDRSGTYKPQGTFDVYVNDELIASGVKYLNDKVKWEATENGTYTMKFVYNPVENDSFIIDDITTTMNIIFPNTITYKGMNAYILGGNGKSELYETTERTQGTSVTIGISISEEFFGTWVITDADGNAVDLGIADLTATEITFTMPDYDIIITSKNALELAADNCDHLCHSDFFLAKIVWKMLNIIFRLFDVQQYCDCGNLHYDAPLFG